MSKTIQEWLKPILQAVIGGLITGAGLLYASGISKGEENARIENLVESVKEHHTETTKWQNTEIYRLSNQATENKTNIANLEKSLTEIKQQNERILRAVSRGK
jgi:hypothetical protein